VSKRTGWVDGVVYGRAEEKRKVTLENKQVNDGGGQDGPLGEADRICGLSQRIGSREGTGGRI